jgi:hypothetical protein
MARRTTSPKTSQRRKQLLHPDVADLALRTLERNSRLNLVARVLLMLFALAASVLAVLYVHVRADAMVELLQQPRLGTELLGERLLALTAPVLLLALLAGLAAIAAAVIHSRGLDESVRTLDSVNRLRREDEVAVSARGLIVAFEEQLATTKRAHTVLLWLGRTLFIVTLGLFAVSALSAAWHGIDLLTAGLGVTSLAGAVLAVAQGVPHGVAKDVSNVVQLQLAVAGAHRQISLLESDAFAALNHASANANPHQIVLDVQERIERVIARTIEQAERYAEPEPESKPKHGNVFSFSGHERPEAA